MLTHVDSIGIVVSGRWERYLCSIAEELHGIDSEHVLARKAVVDTMNNSQVFTKLCGVINDESLCGVINDDSLCGVINDESPQYPLTYCFRFQSSVIHNLQC